MSELGENSTSSDDDHKIEWKCSFIYNLEKYISFATKLISPLVHTLLYDDEECEYKKSSSWNTVTKQKVPEWIKIKIQHREFFRISP